MSCRLVLTLMLVAAALLFVTPPLAAAQSSAPAAPNCRTPLGIPCVTIHYKQSQWQLFRSGLTDVRHFQKKQTLAVRLDGSTVNRTEKAVGATLSGVTDHGPFSYMYLAPGDLIVRINDQSRTYSSRKPLIWHDRPYRRAADGDAVCRTGILHNGTDFKLDGETTIAGVPVVKWVRGNRRHREEISLAPSLDCAVLKRYAIRRNGFYIPLFIDSMEAFSVEHGEPRPELFQIPVGYTPAEDPHEQRLRQFVARSR